ncbi:hypothetical protein ACIQUF_03075 [Pseudomonas sp. NPDC090233]|uniref:hypothetical protein n=1 Tax=Pseudomonas sp. NPDC090233 TaxID=3364479 RepID=UPI00383B93C2
MRASKKKKIAADIDGQVSKYKYASFKFSPTSKELTNFHVSMEMNADAVALFETQVGGGETRYQVFVGRELEYQARVANIQSIVVKIFDKTNSSGLKYSIKSVTPEFLDSRPRSAEVLFSQPNAGS